MKEKRGLKKISNDCWNLDISFIRWLYPRLKTYLKEGGKCIDLNYYRFNIDDEEKTQKEWILEMIGLCEYLLDSNKWLADDYVNKMRRLGRIWAEVMPCMWW